ncbi:MAG TPA: Mur ligase family protein [Candidatus Dormibacteraeota bacterium]|nr:Mur ligase family protein [Candidatus Dormibacteraeota bacterium]
MTDTAPPGWPEPPAHLHFLGICGYAVSGLALCCLHLGFKVTGSDEDAYPPTTETLDAAGILFSPHHDPANLDRWGVPQLVVLGNQVQADNQELAAARVRGLPLLSEAEAYRGLTNGRQRAVVCGTHGKTTTSALAAFMLEASGCDPGFRLGATSRDFTSTARLGDPRPGGPFVFEGDEYTTSALDQRAKFLHWQPHVVTVLNLELDHPDLYPDLAAYVAPYRELVAGLGTEGHLIYNSADPRAQELAAASSAEVQSFGLASGDWRLTRPPANVAGRLQLLVRTPLGGDLQMDLPGFGAHNAANGLAALATAVQLGADPGQAAQSAARYRGPARRFEVLGVVAGVTVVDDYAHHPTKIRATIAGARQQFGDQVQLVMVHVPHTYSRTKALLQEYRGAFEGLDVLVLGQIEPARERHLAGTVSSRDVAALVSGPELVVVESADAAIGEVLARLEAPAVVVCSSVRGFDDVANRLLRTLSEREG